MATGEQSSATATDPTMEESHGNKRKASLESGQENASAKSPKRAKLDTAGAGSTDAPDGATQAPERSPRRESGTAETKSDAEDEFRQEEASKQELRDASPQPPRRSSPKPSRSPTLSRRPSGPTAEPKQASGPGPDRGRRSISEQEKKRGQRLFGGLLSTLSQKPGGQQQKKRADIERRQQERAQQQRVEDDKRRVDKLAKLSRLREIEQVKFDEEVMRTRHAGMMTQARSFLTKAEPRLFYLPWKLTEDQEDLLQDQIRDAKQTIAREEEQFQRQKRERLRELGVTLPPEPDRPDDRVNGSSNEPDEPAVDDGQKDLEKAAVHQEEIPEKPRNDIEMGEKTTVHENHQEDAGYVMMVNEEDTVIY